MQKVKIQKQQIQIKKYFYQNVKLRKLIRFEKQETIGFFINLGLKAPLSKIPLFTDIPLFCFRRVY